MPPRGREVEKALLAWVNSFKNLPRHANTLADLSDGAIFLSILENLDSAYADEITLDDAGPGSKWLAKKTNLEKIYRSLVRYMNNHCDFPSFALEEPVDFNAIAEHDDAEQTIKLLKIFLMAAIKSPENEQYIMEIQALPDSVASQIAEIIQSMEREKDKSQSTKTEDAGISPKMSNSADLAVEEEFAKLTIQYENLLKRNADQRTSNESLRYHNEQLLATLREKQEEIKQLSGSNSEETNSTYIQNLRNRIQEQEDVIARLEYEVKDNHTSTGKQEKELANLRPLTRRVQDLQDSISELQNSNALLTKKANKVDRYEEKLRNAAVLEKEMARLREQNATLERNQATFDEVHEHNRRLDSETAAYRKKMEQYELEFHEHQRRISFLEDECHAKDIKLRELNAKELADEQHIHELEEQVKMVPNVPRSPNSPSTATRGLNLEAELEQSEGHHPNYTLEIARLKAENQLLKSDSAGTSNATLRVELETAARLQKRLESQLQELTEKHAIGQEQLNAVMSSDMGEKNEAIANIRRLWLDATRELTATKSRLEDLQLKLTDRDRQLLTVKADLNAVDKEEIDALDELRSTNETITASLQNDLLVLQGHHKAITADFEQQKTQLFEALVTKDKLLQELTTLKEMLNTNDHVLHEKMKAEQRLHEEKAQNDLNEQLNKQELVIQDLKQQLKAASENTPDAQKAKHEAMIKNLMRENALITTAWYDLTSRLQSNNVVIQRRQDAPKSWLNRQRQLVNATPRR